MFTLKFSTANEAFDDREHEIARILRSITAKVSRGDTGGNVMDVNGNTIGSWSLED